MNLFNYDGKIYKFLSKFWNIVWISVLWLVCSIPLVTIGPASTAAYYAMAKSVRNGDDTVTKDFFRSFKKNFLQGLILGIVYSVVAFAFTYAAVFYYKGSGNISFAMRWIFYLLILILMNTVSYAFAFLSRFEMKTFNAITYPIALSMIHIKNSVGLIVFRAAAIIVLYWSYNTFMFAILILMLPGFICFLDTFMLEPLLKNYEPLAAKNETTSEEVTEVGKEDEENE